MLRKKKIVFNSNNSKAKTGFGRTAKILLKYLHDKNYEIVEYSSCVKVDNPFLNTFPWKVRGSIPASDTEFEQMAAQNGGAKQFLSYGPIYINQVIEEERPDVFIGAEDPWATFVFARNQIWWNKVNCVSWITFDSIPLHRDTVQNLDKYEHLLVKASFAQKELEKLGKEAFWMPDLIDPKEFFPLSSEHRAAMRRQADLDDCLIFGFVFKNQLRKLVIPLMEGFKQFQTENPNVKAKLFLYTDFGATSWDIPYAMEELGIKNEDVLSCYICRECHRFSIEPYRKHLKGKEHTCPFCHKDNSFFHPDGNGHGVKEEELNLIYNFMDAYFHPHTSGGFEMPILEAIYAGLPVATTGYTSGEMYTESGFVENIEHTFTREHNSNFKKAVPYPESIAAIMKKFSDLGAKGRTEYANKARQWALKTFDIEKWCKWFADYIDALPPVKWDWDFRHKPNIEFGFPMTAKTDEEFIERLHEGIWGKKPGEEEKKQMMAVLQGEHKEHPRLALYKSAIGIARQQHERQKEPKPEDFIKESENKKVIFMLRGEEKESIIALPVVNAMKKKYEGWDIYLSCGSCAANIMAEAGLIQIPFIPNVEFWRDSVNKIEIF